MDSVTSGTRPTIPSDRFSASVKAVDLLKDGSRSASIPCLVVVITVLLLPSAGFCNVRVDHLRRIDDAVELAFRDKPQFQCGLFEGEVVVQRVVRDLRGFVIADDG